MEKKIDLQWEAIFRDAIRDSGLSNYRIAKESGVTVSQIGRFMRGERGLTIESAERIGHIVGVKLSRKRGKNENHAM